MHNPATKAGRWLLERTHWDEGMRGFFVRINTSAAADDMLRHILAIEREAREGYVPASLSPEWHAELEMTRAEAAADERERIAPLVEAAREHGTCSCSAMLAEGPRPIGGGRSYHYQGCDSDPALRKALDDLNS